MKKTALCSYLLSFSIASVLFASNEDPHIPTNLPPLHPAEEKVVPETFVPEFGYYFTKQASKENILMGPCAPCVCMQICNKNNDECLYAHQNGLNDYEAPVKKVYEYFTLADDVKPELKVTLFTNTDPTHIHKTTFQEGSHKKRIAKLAETLKKNSNTATTTIYYTCLPDKQDKKYGYANRVILFKNRQPYRININKQEGINHLGVLSNFKDYRLKTYLDHKFRKNFGDRVYKSRQDAIYNSFDNPLFKIKKPNITKINNLPPSLIDPSLEYNDLPSTTKSIARFLLACLFI